MESCLGQLGRFCECSFNSEDFILSITGATGTLPYFWTVNMESRADFVPRAIFQPDCLIGNSESWENLSRISDWTMVFYVCPAVLHARSVFDNAKMETPDG